MLKAKAKAAATAAKQKKLAAERAAALAAQQAEKQANSIPAPVVGSSTGARGGRPSVTQYWVDNQSSALAPGGGIQRIGYDQAKFEDAIRAVVIDPKPASFETPEEGSDEKAATTSAVVEGKKSAESEVKEVDVKVDATSVELLVQEFDLPPKVAKDALITSKNDIQVAIDALLTPPTFLPSRSGQAASRLVSI